ncbi:hypothetical protein [Methylophilus sp. TWE2]|uniref:hypothetical protein n=1 Tax=Methylophilus sp. TWE2 TaxID=1662285 RepID=UPI0006716F24|nr:hypothetical protein [Methylophilus sp. TWE2]AKR44001.1 hypothetical protein ACJ67_11705 [Methylophilus sp. TWE2]
MMSISLEEAASKLYDSLNLPKGYYNIIPLNDKGGKHLLVWIDPHIFFNRSNIPKTFDGFSVTVQDKPIATAQ